MEMSGIKPFIAAFNATPAATTVAAPIAAATAVEPKAAAATPVAPKDAAAPATAVPTLIKNGTTCGI
jgi:hypothetical protein